MTYLVDGFKPYVLNKVNFMEETFKKLKKEY